MTPRSNPRGGLAENFTREARLTAVLEQHKRDLADVIAIAGRNQSNRILSQLGEKAVRILQTIGRIESSPFLTASGFDDLGEWGENGRAPAIRGMLTEAKFHDAAARKAAA